MKTKYVIKHTYPQYDGTVKIEYFVGYDADGDQDWTMWLDSATLYTMAEAQDVAEELDLDPNTHAIVAETGGVLT